MSVGSCAEGPERPRVWERCRSELPARRGRPARCEPAPRLPGRRRIHRAGRYGGRSWTQGSPERHRPAGRAPEASTSPGIRNSCVKASRLRTPCGPTGLVSGVVSRSAEQQLRAVYTQLIEACTPMIVTEQIGHHQTMEVHGSSGDIPHQDGGEGDSDTTAFLADQARIRSAEGGTRNALAVANPVDTSELKNLIPWQATLPDSGRSAGSGAGSGDSAPVVPGGVTTAPVAVPPVPPGGKVSVPPPGLVPRTDPQQGIREPEFDHLPTFVPALGRGTRVVSIFFMLCYVGVLMLFWRSWFRPAQLGFLGFLGVLGSIGGSLTYIVITSVKLRRVNPALPLGIFASPLS